MNSDARRLLLPALLGLPVVLACDAERPSSPAVGAAPCTVEPVGPPERILLVSEAHAARTAARKNDADFVLSGHGPAAVRLQLTHVGCSCYQVRHEHRSLRVGDDVVIAANAATRVRITADPPTEPGVRDFRAEFAGRHQDGAAFTLSLSHSIRTLPDLVVRPDVVHVDLQSALSGEGIPVDIEQTVRAHDPDEVAVTWDALPAGIAATPPVLAQPGTLIGAGLWRVRWRSTVAMQRGIATASGEGPLTLSVVSRRSGAEIARTSCALIARPLSGIVAPRLVHLGRAPSGTTAVRRIQLRAADAHCFAVLSATSRHGIVAARALSSLPEAEHWVEISTTGTSSPFRDELQIETDHPVTPFVRIDVRSLGAGSRVAMP